MPFGPTISTPRLFAFSRSLVVPAGVAIALIAGCASPRQTYVSQHPNLTPEHRKIITAGKLADRDPVAGMTREEIQLTMGVEPTQTTTVNGVDVLIWVKRKPDPLSMMEGTDRAGSSTGSGSFSSLPPESSQTPSKKVNIRTTVFFQGDLAVHVDVREEPLGL